MNEAVLGALGEQVLSPQVVQAAVARARDRLLHATPDADVQPLREALASVERELTRLTAALATGADLPTVVEAIREREARKVTLKRRLEAVGDLARVPLPDPQHLEAALRQTAGGLAWPPGPTRRASPTDAAETDRGTLGGHTRRALCRGDRHRYAREILQRDHVSKGHGVPKGIRTRVLALKGRTGWIC